MVNTMCLMQWEVRWHASSRLEEYWDDLHVSICPNRGWNPDQSGLVLSTVSFINHSLFIKVYENVNALLIVYHSPFSL